MQYQGTNEELTTKQQLSSDTDEAGSFDPLSSVPQEPPIVIAPSEEEKVEQPPKTVFPKERLDLRRMNMHASRQ